jgi:hypothetical protein
VGLNPGHGLLEKFRPDSPHRSENALSSHDRAILARCAFLQILSRKSRLPKMMTLIRRPFALLMLATLVVGGGDALAQDRGQGGGRGQDRGGQGQDRGGQDRGHERSSDRRELSDSVRRVERRTGGQVLSAERVPYDGRDVNRVKVVDSSGRVRIYMDDPQTRDRSREREEPTRRDDD